MEQETKKETKLVPPSTLVIEPKERQETVITFDKSSADFTFLMDLCSGLLDNGYQCTIRATGIYNQIGIVIEHPLDD